EAGDVADGLALLFDAGSVAVGLDRAGVFRGDYRFATDALIGRAFILLGDRERARVWLASALGQGEDLGRSDAQLSGILRDLAFLAEKDGDAARAVALRTRADACDLRCGEDIVWLVALDAASFSEEAETALGSEAAFDAIRDARVADGDAFARAIAPDGRLLGRLLLREADLVPTAEAAPRIAEALALLEAGGVAPEELWRDRLKLVPALAAAGDREAAVAAADALIAELAARPADDVDARRNAVGAARAKVTVLTGAGDDARLAAAYAGAVDLALAALRAPSVSARDLNVLDIVRTGLVLHFEATARPLVERLLAFEPGETDVLKLLLEIAERTGDAAAAARLRADLEPSFEGARVRALSIYDGDSVWLLATWPGILGTYESLADAYGGDDGLYRDYAIAPSLGAAAVALADVGTDADRIAADVAVARFFLVRGDTGEGRRRLLDALARALAEGRGDRDAATILRDLARLEREAGDAAAAAAYEARAAACPLPCTDDLMADFRRDVLAARRAAERSPDAASANLDDLAAPAGITAAETIFAGEPDLARAALQYFAYRYAATRPWQAIDLYQRILEMKQAAGDDDLYGTRVDLANLLLQTNEFARAVAFIDGFRGATVGDDFPVKLARLRARALWHLDDPGAREAYAAIVAMPRLSTESQADILKDLIDAGYADLAVAYADRLLEAYPGSDEPLLVKGWAAAREGRYAEAAALLGEAREPHFLSRLQRAYYLEAAGRADEAAAIRAALDIEAWATASPVFSLDPPAVDEIIDIRDYGAFEAAAEGARRMMRNYDVSGPVPPRLGYRDAQILWQIAYTLARAGDGEEAFALMKAAAATAARISFEQAGGPGGGSLQLLRRDRFRYLLFVDIAWAWTTGVPPAGMTMSSRY
ncbi:MAG TPA: hypothetical protein PKA74_12860, partial [Bauldia sp.]|nr:hypothetical protein [Bauldia sp.]